jgi:hypothetical protein
MQSCSHVRKKALAYTTANGINNPTNPTHPPSTKATTAMTTQPTTARDQEVYLCSCGGSPATRSRQQGKALQPSSCRGRDPSSCSKGLGNLPSRLIRRSNDIETKGSAKAPCFDSKHKHNIRTCNVEYNGYNIEPIVLQSFGQDPMLPLNSCPTSCSSSKCRMHEAEKWANHNQNSSMHHTRTHS